MKRLSFLIALMIALNWPGPARAEADIYKFCGADRLAYMKAISYNEFSEAHENSQVTFVQFWLGGYTSGISLRDPLCGKRISACIDSTSPNQQLVMLKKKAQNTPEKWGMDHITAIYIFNSFVDPCLKGEIPLKKKK